MDVTLPPLGGPRGSYMLLHQAKNNPGCEQKAQMFVSGVERFRLKTQEQTNGVVACKDKVGTLKLVYK